MFILKKEVEERLELGFATIVIGKKQVFDIMAKTKSNKRNFNVIIKNKGQKTKDKSFTRLDNLLGMELLKL